MSVVLGGGEVLLLVAPVALELVGLAGGVAEFELFIVESVLGVAGAGGVGAVLGVAGVFGLAVVFGVVGVFERLSPVAAGDPLGVVLPVLPGLVVPFVCA